MPDRCPRVAEHSPGVSAVAGLAGRPLLRVCTGSSAGDVLVGYAGGDTWHVQAIDLEQHPTPMSGFMPALVLAGSRASRLAGGATLASPRAIADGLAWHEAHAAAAIAWHETHGAAADRWRATHKADAYAWAAT
ncbi:hypothetical protein [Demequina pelophila]|uniref:hypothetical protein n=1 Tax=Demequina pelophila TaxID=1638984 RepID=UPI000785DEF5|nr:hypothetical protein [Demequina pelophila]